MTEKMPKRYAPGEIEPKWQREWLKQDIYRFNVHSDRKTYSIDTPPPFTSGKLHLGHILNFLWIDFVARYKRMMDYEVLCPQGWDCQGLPTELKVEENYQITKDKREEFRLACMDWTDKQIERMKEQMTMAGYIPDWSREYRTMSPEYWRDVQHSLLEFYKQGMIYKKDHPVHFCLSCGTAIAKAEIEYVTRKTTLNYVKFPLKEGNYLKIATTRPELILACVAIAINPADERYKGLSGKEAIIPLTTRSVKIFESDAVDIEFGTGAVMICTFGDEQDVKWVYDQNLDVIKAVDEHGKLTSECGAYGGLGIKEAREKIIEDLKKENLVYREETISQKVGVHERCKKPVEFILTNQWFIDIRSSKEKILELNSSINWVPKHMGKRFDEWVRNLDWDWVFSRQRVFGTPFPFWICKNCDKIILPDEGELPVDPALEERKCPDCGNITEGVGDVCDCWIDSSITPLIISKGPSDTVYFKKTYPNTLRPQGHDIIRTWAFYTIFRCFILTGKLPFTDILVNGMILGPDGRKMSKSLGNVIEPNELIDKYGADSIRQWAASVVPGKDTVLLEKDMEYGAKFLTKLWNSARFVEMHLKEFDPTTEVKLKPMDEWILAKLDELINNVVKSLDQYNFTVIRDVQGFIWHDFCDNYLELIKHRLYKPEIWGEESKTAAQFTLYSVLFDSLLLLSPFIPHFTEEICQRLFKDNVGENSIHGCKFPVSRNVDVKFIEIGDLAIQIASEIRKYKSSNGIPLGKELNGVTIQISKDLLPKIEIVKDDIRGAGRIIDLKVEGRDADGFEIVVGDI